MSRIQTTNFDLNYDGPSVLALGGHSKANLTLLERGRAQLISGFGSLETVDTIASFRDAVYTLMSSSSYPVEIVAHDLHPDFYSSMLARILGVETLAIQHHHAHIGVAMAENDVRGPVLGVAIDGFGFGSDGTSWGGELLYVNSKSAERLAHFVQLKQPGGDAAVEQVWRLGVSVLHTLGRYDFIEECFGKCDGVDIVVRMLERDFNCPVTSSCGRWFDAAASLLGVCLFSQSEGQAAIELERICGQPIIDSDLVSFVDGNLDIYPLCERLVGLSDILGSSVFHGTLSKGISTWVLMACRNRELNGVVLCGGCMYNRVLYRLIREELMPLGIKLLHPAIVGPGDDGISLGQAWLAGLSSS